eukprot:11162591-Lingulodinium_polyedra.AAC.1
MAHRARKGTGSRASRLKRPMAPRMRSAPESLKQVDASTPPPSAASHRLSAWALAQNRLLA